MSPISSIVECTYSRPIFRIFATQIPEKTLESVDGNRKGGGAALLAQRVSMG